MNGGGLKTFVVALVLAVAMPGCEARTSPPVAVHHEQATRTGLEQAPKHAASGVVPGSPEDWCGGHEVPESMCTLCNPSLIPQYKASGDWCEAHGLPESICPMCTPQARPAGVEEAAIEARTVRFQSPEIEDRAGIRTVVAHRSDVAPSIACTARIAFDNDRVADIRAIVPGIVRRVRAKLGARVERGAPLFELESTRVGEIQGALQTARARVRVAQANLSRQRQLHVSEIASARQVEVAQRELAAAQAEARSAEVTLRIAGAARASPSGRYTLTTPIEGVVVRRPAVMGLLATEITSLATVVDTSVMWALCDVPDTAASRIAVGQNMRVTIDDAGVAIGETDASIKGVITWISAEVDPRTRTVTARAEIPNPDGRLRANLFARARIETGALRGAVSVPRAAVQRVGERDVVFVRVKRGVYEPRVVRRLGGGDPVQIEGTIHDGDAVVTTGAILLRTEIIPGSIGAGCCEVEAAGGD
ncbi:MAG: efflux RND transporter periplasmic adaptor subunit [Nannocystaceae bacterium]